MAILVHASALAGAAVIASSEPTRPQLNGVHVNAQGWVTATDGHALIEIGPPASSQAALVADYPLPDGGHGEDINGAGIIVPSAAAVAGAKSAPKAKGVHDGLRDRVLVIARGVQAGELWSTDLDARRSERFRAIDGPYPDVVQVRPKGKPALAIGLSLSLLKRVVTALERSGVTANGCGDGDVVRFEFREPLGAVAFSATTHDERAVRGLIMPMRLPESVGLSAAP